MSTKISSTINEATAACGISRITLRGPLTKEKRKREGPKANAKHELPSVNRRVNGEHLRLVLG